MSAVPDTQAIIDTFMARRSACAVCGAVAWKTGDLLRAPIVELPIRALTGPQSIMQSFCCTSCNHVVLIAVGRTAGTP